MPVKATRPRLGLALSGGALKASAHVGVLSGLNDMGIYPECVAGTSAGAFVATLYAHGLREPGFTELLRRFPGRKLLDYGFPVSSALWNLVSSRFLGGGHVPKLPAALLRGRYLQHYISHVLRDVSDRPDILPYYVIATDLWTGQPITFSNDSQAQTAGMAQPVEDLVQVVRASCSLPGIFGPIRRDPWLLADGACRHYVPVQVLRDVGCEKVIAINLHTLDHDWTPQTFVHVIARSYEILLQDAVEHDVEEPDVYVLAPEVGHLTWFSFDQMQSGVTAGKNAVESHQQEIKTFLSKTGSPTRSRPVPSLHIGSSARAENQREQPNGKSANPDVS